MGMTSARDPATEIPLVGHVVGENLKRLRTEWRLTQAEAARRLQAAGIRWTRSHVAAFEAGNRETVDVGTLILIARAFEVPPRELFAGEGRVRLSADTVWTRRVLRELLSGERKVSEAAELSQHAWRIFIELASGTYTVVNPYQADTELASRMGVAPADLIRAAEGLWGHSLQQERDRRIAEFEPMGAAERRARRGHITRVLTKELDPYLPGEVER